MTEEVDLCIEMTKEGMQNALDHLERELGKIRAGKANPQMLDSVMVDYYGASTPLNRVSNVNASDARTIVVQPWEKNMIQEIERAIMAANLGLNPQNNGEVIHINVPVLTEERRKQLVKQARTEGESAKVSVRNTRRDGNEELKLMKKDGLSEDMTKRAEDQIQELTNEFIEKIDEMVAEKENDIMTV